MPHGQFRFNGSGLGYFWLMLWTGLVTAITFGLFFPWAMSATMRWKCKNTTIDGKPLCFKGTGGGFFGNFLLILIFTLITFGIYAPWGYCRITRWAINNTYFADAGDIEH